MSFVIDCSSSFRSKLYISLSVFGILGLLLSGYTLGSSYLSVSGHGDWGMPGQELVVWLCLLGMVIMAVAVVGLCFSKFRFAALAVMLGCGLMVVLIIISLKSSDKIRMHGFTRLANEAAPLVAAIHAYSKKHGYPPESLDALQVKYPPSHVIKGGVLPDFEYLPGDRARESYHGNPWVLILETPTGPFRWDRFIYYPLQNYPPLGRSGWFEKVGKWAYIHE